MAKQVKELEHLSGLLPEEKKEEKPKPKINPLGFYDYDKEIIEPEEGLVYEKKRGNRKGKVLRKFCEKLYGCSWDDDKVPYYWRPKLKDIPGCEASRWRSVLYSVNQMKEFDGFWDRLVAECPLRYIRLCEKWPGFEWHMIEKHESHYSSKFQWSISDGYVRENSEKEMNYPVKQDVGDAYRRYNDRCREIRTRTGYFEYLFSRAIELKYSHSYYNHEFRHLKLIINGREYIIGSSSGELGKFGITVFPERIGTEVIS